MRARLPAGRARIRLMARDRRVSIRLVPQRPPLARRLATAARWPVGIGLTSWSYMWRTTPMHRSEEAGAPGDADPPELPGGVSRDGVRSAPAGPGRLFHRRSAAVVREPRLSPEALIERVAGDLNKVTP